MSKALAISKGGIRKYDLDTPGQMVQMSKALQSHIQSQSLSVDISGKKYTQVEGWQFAGGLLGYVVRIKSVENLSSGTEKKWRADAELVRIKDGTIMGNGVAICSNTEAKKRGFDEYAICSMAQTRAIGKAYRNLIGWVMKMAGYEGTPSEEILKVDQTAPQNAQNKENSGVKQGYPPQSGINSHSGSKSSPQANSGDYMPRLKDRLMKLGAKDEKTALRLLFQKTGLVWKSFANHGNVNVKEAYIKLLNNK